MYYSDQIRSHYPIAPKRRLDHDPVSTIQFFDLIKQIWFYESVSDGFMVRTSSDEENINMASLVL
jgi:hypothetical protein